MSIYQTLSQADTLAASLPQSVLIVAYRAGDDPTRQAWLDQAEDDIDHSMRWQGRKFDMATPQVREFPRVAYERGSNIPGLLGVDPLVCNRPEIWDWDSVNNVPIVPTDVLKAMVHQAGFIASGGDADLDDLHAGITSEKMGTGAKTYNLNAKAAETGLGRRAFQLLDKYKLVSGRYL